MKTKGLPAKMEPHKVAKRHPNLIPTKVQLDVVPYNKPNSKQKNRPKHQHQNTVSQGPQETYLVTGIHFNCKECAADMQNAQIVSQDELSEEKKNS